MRKPSFSMLTALGIVGVVATVAVLAVTQQIPTLAQECSGLEESYIGNLPGCVNPPATEEECRAFAGERSRNAYDLHNANVARIQTLWNEALGVSAEIRADEINAVSDIRDERMRDLNATTATAVAGAKALFYSCSLAAVALPSPADGVAMAKCIGWHALKMSVILTNHNRKKNSIEDQWYESYGRIDAEANARDRLINDRQTKSSNREIVRYEMKTSLIATDLEHCIWRVNND